MGCVIVHVKLYIHVYTCMYMCHNNTHLLKHTPPSSVYMYQLVSTDGTISGRKNNPAVPRELLAEVH